MKAGLTREKIIEAAAAMADEKGIAGLTFKELAAELGIKPPSLYKHFAGGLDELGNELMLYCWRSVESEIVAAAIGKAKDDAIRAVFYAYRKYVTGHPGLSETMHRYNMYRSEEHLKATEGIVTVMFRVLDAYGLTDGQKVHIVRMLRAFLQGFTAIECRGGFGNPVPTDETFDFALNTILSGIRDLQGGNAQ